MFYQEKVINNIKYCRNTPYGDWVVKVYPDLAPTPDETPGPRPWTEEDDKKLAALLDRKARAEQVKFERVLLVVEDFPYCDTNDELVRALIDNATALHAALKPYDKEAS